MTDYRGITLMSIAGKVYNRMILNRIYDPINERLRPYQAGFRRGHSCLEQIHILKRVMEAYQQRQLPLIAIFIDFSKAFDSVDREMIWKILRHYGVPVKIVSAISALYRGCSNRVRISGQLSEPFTVNTGVLQGDTLAPFLFVVVLDYVLRQTHPDCGLRTHPDVTLPDLDFADDIVLLDPEENRAGRHFRDLVHAARAVGLAVNYQKTKLMYCNCIPSQPTHDDLRQIDIVTDFKYLGSRIVSSLEDFRQRKAIAWNKFWQLSNVWRSKTIDITLKLRLFDSLILSILLYGAEAWSLTQRMKKQLNAFGTSCYRVMLGIRRIDRVSNAHVLQKTKRSNISDKLLQQQLRTLGHWLRRPDGENIKRYALYTTNQGRGRRGRPPHTYVKNILSLLNMDEAEIRTLAANRDEWRTLVNVVGRGDSRAPD